MNVIPNGRPEKACGLLSVSKRQVEGTMVIAFTIFAKVITFGHRHNYRRSFICRNSKLLHIQTYNLFSCIRYNENFNLFNSDMIQLYCIQSNSFANIKTDSDLQK